MLRRLSVFLFAVLFLSCGGGGGSSTPAVSVSLDHTSLTFVTFQGVSFAPQTVTGTLTAGSGQYYLGAESSLPGLFYASFSFPTSTSASATLSQASSASLPVGVQTGTITFVLCKNADGSGQVWSASIPVQVVVFSAALTQATLQAPEQGAPVATQITLTPADPDHQVSLAPPTAPWASAARTDAATWTVSGAPGTLTTGAYLTNLILSTGGVKLILPLTLQVNPDLTVPAPAAVVLSPTTLPADLTGTFQVTCGLTGNPAWTAESDRAWLVLGAAGGNGTGTLAYTLDPASLGTLAVGASDTATVTFTGPNPTPTTTQVTVTNALPVIHSVAPQTVAPRTPVQIMVHGSGFSHLAATDFLVGGVAVASGTIQSDTQALLQAPGLQAGLYAVSVRLQAALPAVDADLAVAAPGVFPAAAVPHSGAILAAVYDPSRQAVFASNTDLNGLERIQWNGSQWVTTILPIASVGTLGLAPDHRTVQVTSGSNTLLAIDPDTLTITGSASYPSTGSYSPWVLETQGSRPLAATFNGRLWFAPEGWEPPLYFDLADRTFQALTTDTIQPTGTIYVGETSASSDGSRVFISVYDGEPSPWPNGYLYLADSDTLTTSMAIPSFGYTALNQDGSLLSDGYGMYDTTTYQLHGVLQDASGQGGSSNCPVLLSPDGSRAYLLTVDPATQLYGIDAYDTTTLVPGTTRLVKLGRVALAAQPAVSYPYSFNNGGYFQDPAGTTLFLLDGANLIVVPVPAGLLPVQAPTATLRPLKPPKATL